MTYSKNKKAYFDYEIIETIEAGISLTGAEVKSTRKSNIQLKGSYVSIKDGQIKLISSHISRPDYLGNASFTEMRDRNLLLHKKELNKLHTKVKVKGFSIVALEVYQPENSKKIKVKIALVRGKREFDKRETIKRREADIDTKRQMKDH